ncbi:hypothetical protein ASF84_10775 [Pseudomonas sp. Leaf127]|uniref:hypothetical protein n=1 Tax=Pseudomonas sp. Leaf127 TaxID=1736267 RepID=UPI00070292B6|nr:hypothetical protein [Pseudomonas sp. Leaf127]KQQ55807.1 hypothetical protein ASF84_10775 [Pseudomonas sp. Leaf127]
MLVSNSTIENLASRFAVGRGALDELSQASFSLVAPPPVQAAAATLSSSADHSASHKGAGGSTAYDESFARMMLGLKTQTETTVSDAVAERDNTASGDTALAANDTTYTSAQQQFLDYMKLPAEDRLREQLTGVSKEEYEAMSPEEKRGVDEKFKDALKQQQEVAQQDINVRIKALKAGLIG